MKRSGASCLLLATVCGGCVATDPLHVESEPESPPVEAPVPPEPRAIPNGGSLHGRITNREGFPVPGAELHLEGLFSSVDGSRGPDSLVAFSDSDGRYTIRDVPPGNRRLNVSAEGYANQTKAGFVFRHDSPLLTDVKLELAETICGTVTDESGQPIEGAQVLALSYSNSNRQCRDTAQTDAYGEFCLTHVAAGKYTIAVTADRYRSAHENRVPTLGDDLIVELAESGFVHGTVIAAGGPPSTPFRVQLRRTHPGTNITSLVGKKYSFEGEGGEFDIECNTTGTYCVEAEAPGFAPTFSEEFRFTLGQPTDGIVVVLTRGGSLRGRVLDDEGLPVEGARITTHPNDWSNNPFDRALGDQYPTNATWRAAESDSAGEFELPHLAAEVYQLRITAPGWSQVALKDIVVREGTATDLGGVLLVRGGELTGSVTDSAGQATVGARVRLFPSGPGGPSRGDHWTVTGAYGEYGFVNVTPGLYELTAFFTGAGYDPARFPRGPEFGRLVRMESGESSRVDLLLER